MSDLSEPIRNIRQNRAFAEKRKPEEASEVLKYAREAGISFEAAEADAKHIGLPAKIQKWDSIAREHPALRDYLRDPGFAAAFQDDVENLSATEKILKAARATKQSWRKGELTMELAHISDLDREKRATPEQLFRATQIERALAEPDEAEGLSFLLGVPAAVAGSLPLMIKASDRGAQGAVLGAAAAGATGALLGAPTGPGAAASGGAGLVGGAMLGLQAGMVLGGAEGAGLQERAISRREFIAAGATEEEANAASDIVGLAVGALELPAGAVLTKFIPGIGSLISKVPMRDVMRRVIASTSGKAVLARFAARVAESSLTEGLVEVGQDLAKEITAVAYDIPGAQISDGEHYAQTFRGGAQGGFGFGLSGAAPAAVPEIAEARGASQRVAMFQAIAEGAKNSKTIQRMPEVHRAYVEHILEKYPEAPPEVKVPAQAMFKLFQEDDLIQKTVEEKMPNVARQIEEAKKSGDAEAEIVVPMSDVATYLAPLKQFPEAIAPDLRVGNELTLNEEKKLQSEVEKVKEQIKALPPAQKESTDKIYDDVYNQLVAAGAYPEVATEQATLVTAFARVMGEDLKQDPFDYYQSMQLQIERSGITPAQKAPAASKQLVDLLRQKDAENILLQDDYIDGLTGLYNERAGRVMPVPEGKKFLAVFGLEGKKHLNDDHTHDAFDGALRTMAQVIQSSGLTGFKVDGDVQAYVSGLAEAQQIAAAMQSALDPEGRFKVTTNGAERGASFDKSIEAAYTALDADTKKLRGEGKLSHRKAPPAAVMAAVPGIRGMPQVAWDDDMPGLKPDDPLVAPYLAQAKEATRGVGERLAAVKKTKYSPITDHIRADSKRYSKRERAERAYIEKETGLLSLVGWNRTGALQKHKASLDLRSLKKMNDPKLFGRKGADRVLVVLGRAMTAAGLADFYASRLHGDELAMAYKNKKRLLRVVEKLDSLLQNVKLFKMNKDENGNKYLVVQDGISIAWGVGTGDLQVADADLEVRKKAPHEAFKKAEADLAKLKKDLGNAKDEKQIKKLTAAVEKARKNLQEARAKKESAKPHEPYAITDPAAIEAKLAELKAAGAIDLGSELDGRPVGGQTLALLEGGAGADTGRDGGRRGRLEQTQRKRTRGYTEGFASGEIKITLTPDANFSTFLHESGHVFLTMMQRDAAKSPAIAARLKKIYEWLDAKDGQPLTREQHEHFARGFENFLREGKAPTEGLRAAFRSFASWLKIIYKNVLALRKDLTDEVREAMSRMIATDYELEAARNKLGIQPDTTGMSEAEAARFTKAFNAAMEEARNDLEQRTMESVSRLFGEERAKVRRAVIEETERNPVYNALEALRTGKRLDGAAIPEEVAGKKLDRARLREMLAPGGKWTRRMDEISTDAGGLDPEAAAPYFGFKDGADLVWSVWGAKNRQSYIEQKTKEMMAERFPEAQISAMTEQAKASLHDSPLVEEYLFEQAEAAAKRSTVRSISRVTKEALKQAAREAVDAMTMLEMQPSVHERAERRFADAWAKAWKKGDYDAAYKASLGQIDAYYKWKYVTEARRRVEQIRKNLRKYTEIPARRRLAKAGRHYLEAVDRLLERIDLLPRSREKLDQRASMRALIEMAEEDGAILNLHPNIFEEASLKNYKEMALSDLETINDAVKNLAHAASKVNKEFDGRKERDFKETVARFAQNIKAKAGMKYAEKVGDNQNPDAVERALELAAKSHAEKSKVEFVCRELDGGETAALAHELIFQPIADAETRRNEMFREVIVKTMKPFRALDFKARRRLDEKVDFLGRKLRRAELLILAAYMGSASSRRKLLLGYADRGWTEEAVLQKLGEYLTSQDCDLIEHIWESAGQLWGEVEELSRRTTGIMPAKVEPLPITINGRKLKGGYLPIVYDRRRSHKGEQIAQKKAELFENNFMQATVGHGFTESRTGFYAPILLSLDTVPAHLAEVVHYLTHFEAVRAVDRLLQSRPVREAITEALGREKYKLFRPWLQAIAKDGSVHEGLTSYDKVLRHLRVGATVSALGCKVTTALFQTLGLTTTIKEIGLKHTLVGIGRFLKEIELSTDPFRKAKEQSKHLRDFGVQMDRELLGQFQASTSLVKGLRVYTNGATHYSLALMNLVQQSVNTITWFGAYEKALNEGHARPEDYADSKVRLSQMGEGVKDKAAIQRGTEAARMFTVMYGYFSVLYNQMFENAPASAKTPEKIATYAARWWWLIGLPVLIDTLLRDDIGDDPEEWAKKLGKEQLFYIARTMPMFSLATEGLLADHETRFAPWITTILRGLKATGNAAFEGKELTETELRDIWNSLGTVSATPTPAMSNAYRYLEAFTDGKMEEPVQNLLLRSPSKWE